MRVRKKPTKFSEISRSSRCSVECGPSGTVKILRMVSRVASAFLLGAELSGTMHSLEA